eukprot:532581-Amphidinium_carterae.1
MYHSVGWFLSQHQICCKAGVGKVPAQGVLRLATGHYYLVVEAARLREVAKREWLREACGF